MARAYAISDPTKGHNPEYVDGLRVAVATALDYGFAGVECGDEQPSSPPVGLLAQARLAARNGVPISTVLLRYFAGYTLLMDFFLQEVERDPDNLADYAVLVRVMRNQLTRFDQLVRLVVSEYTRDAKLRSNSVEQRRYECARRLIAGETHETSDLSYDFGLCHIAVVARGAGSIGAIRQLASTTGQRLLLVKRNDGTVWAWFGGRRRSDPPEIEHRIASIWPENACLAIGEPGTGLKGWRLSHLQAQAALPIALREPGAPIRYGKVALLASMLKDDLLLRSLRELYVAPLQNGRGDGKTAQETLQAYFASERKVASAAHALGVSRQTMENRLKAIERSLGIPLSAYATDLEVALRLNDVAMTDPAAPEWSAN